MTFCVACLDKNGRAEYFKGRTCPVCGWEEPKWIAPLAKKLASALFEKTPDWVCPVCGKVWKIPIGKPICLGCPGKNENTTGMP